MGDRVIFVVTDGHGDVSPSIYGHWLGDKAEQIIRKAAPTMRTGDVGYAALALAAVVHAEALSDGKGWASAGLLEGPASATPDALEMVNQGDAGVYLVNIHTGRVTVTGGYGVAFDIDPKTFAQG